MTKDLMPPKTLSDRLRTATDDLSGSIGRLLHRAGIHPDWVSLTGFVIVAGGASLMAQGQLVLAGWVFFLGTLFDALDGAVARARGIQNPFGAVLDSFLDRYADGFIFGGLGYYFASQTQPGLAVLALVALVGSFAVSYLRARADNPDVGIVVKVGWFSRFERLAIIIVALWLHSWLLIPAIWLLAVGTHLTALQRLWYIRRHIED